jgi:hypothetical protein
VVDSKTWAHIDAMWLEFVGEPCNVGFILAIDGVNPFSEKLIVGFLGQSCCSIAISHHGL